MSEVAALCSRQLLARSRNSSALCKAKANLGWKAGFEKLNGRKETFNMLNAYRPRGNRMALVHKK